MPFPKTLRAAAPGRPEPDWGWRLTAFIQCGKYQIRIYRLLRCCRLRILAVSDIRQIAPQLFQQVDKLGDLLFGQ